jgi:hypothetical protein
MVCGRLVSLFWLWTDVLARPHAVPLWLDMRGFERSCTGIALVSVASFSAVAVTSSSLYADNMNCLATLFNPAGWVVGLDFTAFDTEPFYDGA